MRVMWGCFDIVWRVMRECFEIANYEISHSAWGCLPSSGPHWKILIEYAEPSKVPMPTEGFSINRPLHLNFENVLTRVAKKPTSKNPRRGRGFWDMVTGIATREPRVYRFLSVKIASSRVSRQIQHHVAKMLVAKTPRPQWGISKHGATKSMRCAWGVKNRVSFCRQEGFNSLLDPLSPSPIKFESGPCSQRIG